MEDPFSNDNPTCAYIDHDIVVDKQNKQVEFRKLI